MGKAPKNLTTETITKMRSILTALDESFSLIDEPEFGTLVNYSSRAEEPIHRWFRYREGYSTRLVDAALQTVAKDKLIVDPFCGAGTTLLAARNSGFPSAGIDANPLSAFVARVKTRYYSPTQVNRFKEICIQIKTLTSNAEVYPQPQLSIIGKVFLPEVLHALLVLKSFIETHLARAERDFFFLGWLAILEDVSNVYKEGNGIKYRNRKRTSTGYVEIPIDIWQQSLFPEDKFEHVLKVYLDHMDKMIQDAGRLEGVGREPDVYTGDALHLDEYVQPESSGLVIFSPPYVNNFNYFKAYKIELWMGGFIADYDDLLEVTRRSLRSHVETRLSRDSDANNWYPEALDELIELIDPDTLWTSRILQAIRGYFYDMRQVLKHSLTSLEPDGRCIVVVGNSAYGSVLIPTDTLLAEIASVEGFEVEKIAVARHLTTSSQQKLALEPVRDKLRESILYLRKPKGSVKTERVGEDSYNYQYVTELPKFPRQAPPTVYIIRNQGLTDETHIIHKYPGKFIPHIPRWAIEKYLGETTNRVVLDPFCGSGTSLVEAHIAGHRAYGLDIDPLAKLISKVKTTPIGGAVLKDAVNQVIFEVENQKESIYRPNIDDVDAWFSPEAANDLGVIREVVDKWKGINSDIYDFLIICFSSIIRRVSKADNQSLKTYVSGTHPKNPIPVKPTFIKTLNIYSERVAQFTDTSNPKGNTTILNDTDARTFGSLWEEKNLPKVDLGITSPPYIKTIDYIYNQMAEYFWIGDLFGLDDRNKQNTAKQLYMGTEKISAREYSSMYSFGLESIDAFIERIYSRSAKHSFIFYKFFKDMAAHFQQMSRVLQSKGTYVVVVGDSSISDIPIPTHELLTDVATANNFSLSGQFAYEIRNRYMRFPRQGRGGIVGLDWVMTYSKTS